jgi:hypothetical protein
MHEFKVYYLQLFNFYIQILCFMKTILSVYVLCCCVNGA